jgi:hypothetical protein
MIEPKVVEAFDPGYLSGLGQIPLAKLRAKREECAEQEMELSYVRRLAQARIDLIMAESERRHQGLSERSPEILVGQLPQILGDHTRGDGPGRLPALLAPSEVLQVTLAARVEAVLPSDRLGSLSELGSEELDELLGSVSDLERSVSAERRALHDIQDRLQEELVRRYRSGEASVDALLTSS